MHRNRDDPMERDYFCGRFLMEDRKQLFSFAGYLGVADEEKLPDWAKERLAFLRGETQEEAEEPAIVQG